MKKVIFSTFLLAAFAVNANAQTGATATATATATIVTPIEITNTSDMSFGNLAVNATTGGTVILSPTAVRTESGGVTLPSVTGTVTAAAFTVDGTANYTYSITLPSVAVPLSGPGTDMDATDFTSSLGATGTLDANGTQDFTVGATLTVAGGQTAGVYTSAAFDVTVDYN